jgi:hypothetical protein
MNEQQRPGMRAAVSTNNGPRDVREKGDFVVPRVPSFSERRPPFYTVQPGKVVSTLRGITKAGGDVCAADFMGGAKVIDVLLSKRSVLPAASKSPTPEQTK